MRLLRVGKPVTRVADDVRASLTALGRGDADIGGIALVDVHPAGPEQQFDAVLILPHGIVIVAGIDLPGPAMRLEAPLRGQWKADNWPLVGSGSAGPPAQQGVVGGGAANPATDALAAADALARRLNTLTNMAIPVGLVLAVGPFVDNVVTVPLRGERVRVVYPTPTKLREAIVALSPDGGRPCSVEQARAELRHIDPEVPIQSDDVLAREGFTTGAAYAHAAAQPALAAHTPTTPLQPPARPAQTPAPAAPSAPSTAEAAKAAALAAAAQTVSPVRLQPPQQPHRPHGRVDVDDRPTDLMPLTLPAQTPEPPRRGPEVRLLPIAAVLVVVAGLIAAIVMATTSGSDDSRQPQRPAPEKPERYAISGVEFDEVASTTGQQCQELTYGDVQVAVQKTPCDGMRLGSYLARVSGRQAAVSLAVVDFAEPKQAEQLKKLADKAGSGGAADAANLSEKWPGGKLTFHNAVYRSEVDGSSLRLVRTAWIGEPSSTDDKLLARIATTSFEVPVD
ncbi:MAG: hypothetical protein ACRDQB_08110 [Thermocrispum sp.]